jgi:hypothetical protein
MCLVLSAGYGFALGTAWAWRGSGIWRPHGVARCRRLIEVVKYGSHLANLGQAGENFR